MRPLQKTIDLRAFEHNRARLQAQAGRAGVMMVVKADAYGHGVANLLPVLRKAPLFAVACIEEALQLRALGLTQPVVLLEGVFDKDELPECAAHGFVPWIHEFGQLAWLEARTPQLPFWLKIDSGMHRLGFAGKDRAAALERAKPLQCRGIATHFACADEEDLRHARRQLADFHAVPLPAHWQRSAANSAALFVMPDAHYDWVRPGLALYGMSPFACQSAAQLDLQPVMTLKTQVLAVRYLDRGAGAGYGCGFTAQEAGYLATIALGYGDGFARRIDSGRVMVRIGAATYPLVGRVAMDMCLVWLGKTAVPVGSEVIIFGARHPVETVAAQADTIPYTLTTMLTPRVHTVILG